MRSQNLEYFSFETMNLIEVKLYRSRHLKHKNSPPKISYNKKVEREIFCEKNKTKMLANFSRIRLPLNEKKKEKNMVWKSQRMSAKIY